MRRFKTIPEWVEENLSRYPQADDSIFQLDSAGARTNALLELRGEDPAWACAYGYRIAARLAVEHIREKGRDQSLLVFPIVFLYRHHIELMLKLLIIKADHPAVRYDTKAEELTECVRKKLNASHSLQWLWDQLRPVVKALGAQIVPVEDVQGINSHVRQLSKIDPDSTGFRYTTDIEAVKAKLTNVQGLGTAVGIQTFAGAMERFANYLEGLDSYFGDVIDCYHETASEACDPGY